MAVKKPYYPVLEAKIVVNGLTKKYIAQKLGITERALFRKLAGDVDFRWKEIEKICLIFPDVTPFELLKHNEKR